LNSKTLSYEDTFGHQRGPKGTRVLIARADYVSFYEFMNGYPFSSVNTSYTK